MTPQVERKRHVCALFPSRTQLSGFPSPIFSGPNGSLALTVHWVGAETHKTRCFLFGSLRQPRESNRHRPGLKALVWMLRYSSPKFIFVLTGYRTVCVSPFYVTILWKTLVWYWSSSPLRSVTQRVGKLPRCKHLS